MNRTPATPAFTFVENRWDDGVANRLDPLGRLVYRSNLLGSDWRITNTAGGNTSSKVRERDPLTGASVDVLWVKGSGGDLRTATKANFASLDQRKLLALQETYNGFSERGPKTPAEDAMVGMYAHAIFGGNPRPPSIDTPLHSFIPHAHVDHMHPVSCLAIATASDGPELTREIYGDEVVWIDWLRPGFELGLKLQEVCQERPEARGAMLGGHGLINWADDDRECYLLTLRLVDRAAAHVARFDQGQNAFGGARYSAPPDDQRREMLLEVLPWLRGKLGRNGRLIATVEASDAVMGFVCAEDASRLAELGTSCPDHFLRTKIKPLYVDWDPEREDLDALKAKLDNGLDAYRRDYESYYEACKRQDSPSMRGGDPTVVLIPGIGMIGWGKSKSESRVTAEFYKGAIEVMRGAEAVSAYTALPRQEAFDIEYWALEEAKLKRMPAEKELSRRIAVVAGAGSGIGREVTDRLTREGAVVAALDLDPAAAQGTASATLERIGTGIGVAGTGVSGSGDVIGIGADISDRASVRAALDEVILAYGGLDHIVVTAGVYLSSDASGRIPDESWADSFRVNVTGSYLLADEAHALWLNQGLSGSMVVTTSVNAVVPKAASLAYDASKAASNHLVRELAVRLAPLVRVNGVAPATVVEGSAMFPRDRVIASLAKYGLPYDERDQTDLLRQRLADFYAGRTLMKLPITPADQAEAIFLLLSDRLAKTTGQIINVDGGLPEAFLR